MLAAVLGVRRVLDRLRRPRRVSAAVAADNPLPGEVAGNPKHRETSNPPAGKVKEPIRLALNRGERPGFNRRFAVIGMHSLARGEVFPWACNPNGNPVHRHSGVHVVHAF